MGVSDAFLSYKACNQSRPINVISLGKALEMALLSIAFDLGAGPEDPEAGRSPPGT